MNLEEQRKDDNIKCSGACVTRRQRTKCLFKSHKRALNGSKPNVSVILKSIKARNSTEISTKFNTKTLGAFIFRLKNP